MRPADKLRETIKKLKLVESTALVSSLRKSVENAIKNSLSKPNPFSNDAHPDSKGFWSNGGKITYVKFDFDDRAAFRHIIVRKGTLDHSIPHEREIFNTRQIYDGVSYYMLCPDSFRNGSQTVNAVVDGSCVFTYLFGVNENQPVTEDTEQEEPQQTQKPKTIDMQYAFTKAYERMRGIALETIKNSGVEIVEQFTHGVSNSNVYGAANRRQHWRRELKQTVDCLILRREKEYCGFVCSDDVNTANYGFKKRVAEELKHYLLMNQNSGNNNNDH